MNDFDSKESSAGGSGRRPPREERPSMLDLPLREDERPVPTTGGSASGPAYDPIDEAARREAEPSVRVRRRKDRRRGSRWPLWILLALLLAAIVWWLLPNAAVIEPSQASLEFGPQRVGSSSDGAELVLTNGGERALVIREVGFLGDGAGDFQVEGGECLDGPVAAGEECRLEVRFAPVSRGSRQALLEIVGRAGNSPFELPVSGIARAPQIGLAPERLDFGGTPVDGEKASLDLTISSIGTLPIELGRVTITGDHASEFKRSRRCPKTTLPPGEACTFAVEFSPRVAGPRRALLSIANDAPEEAAEVELVGVGLWDGPVLAADREALDFGEQLRGTRSAGRPVNLRNPMPGPVTISAVTSSGEPFVANASGCAGRTLGPGESCSVEVAFAPETERSFHGSLTIRAAESEEPVVVPLGGIGVQPRLVNETGEFSFGSTRAGLRSGAQEAVFSNAGTGTLRVTGVEVRGEDSGAFTVRRDECSKGGLKAKGRCRVEVAFQPQGEGEQRARLVLSPAAGSEPVEVALSGRGVVAGLAVDRGRLDFGEVYRTRFEDLILTLSNAGSASLAIQGLRIQGEAADDYRLAAVGCRLDVGLEPRESCRISIRFTPTTDGPRPATLAIEHNGSQSPSEVEIAGRGMAPVPVFQASHQRLDFGALAQGSSSPIETLTLSNVGAGWLDLRRVAIRGDNPDDFRIVPGTCEGTTALAPGGDCSLGLRFTPQGPGRRQAFVEIQHGAAGAPARVLLTGEGAL